MEYDNNVHQSNCEGAALVVWLINHLMYADDLAVFSASSAAFQQLLTVFSGSNVKCDRA